MNEKYSVRKFQSGDESSISDLFLKTVRTVCATDYTPEQIKVWTSITQGPDEWLQALSGSHAFVAIEKATDKIVGFADIRSDGLLDRGFVHADYQRQGIGTLMLRARENYARELGLKQVYSNVSVTARPFYIYHGYGIEEPKSVTVSGVELTNYKAKKHLRTCQLQHDNGSRLTLHSSSPGSAINWVFVAGGPGVDSAYLNGLLEIVNLPGNKWLYDFPEGGSNRKGEDYNSRFNFESWKESLLEVIQKLDNVVLIGHSFSAKYILVNPDFENHALGTAILSCSLRSAGSSDEMRDRGQDLPDFSNKLQTFFDDPTAYNFDELKGVCSPYYYSLKDRNLGLNILRKIEWNRFAFSYWVPKLKELSKGPILQPSKPCLILGGDNDPTINFSSFKEDRAYQKSYIIVEEIPKGSHMPWLDSPEKVSSAFSRFLAVIEKTIQDDLNA